MYILSHIFKIVIINIPGMKYIMNDKEYSKRVKIIFCIFFIWYGINCLFLLFKMLLCLPESLIDLGAELTPYFILFTSNVFRNL